MGRNREFDEEAALTKVMHAFRREGYGALSLRDLEKASGLTSGSIYNSWGGKERLFSAAFSHYNRQILQARIARFAPFEAGLDGLRALFTSLLAEPNDEHYGCLITNTAVELGGGAAHPCVDDGLRILSEAFEARLRAARLRDARVLSEKLLALYQGILVLVRANHDKAALKRLINHEFNSLETQS